MDTRRPTPPAHPSPGPGAAAACALIAALAVALAPRPAAAQPGPIESPVKVEFLVSGGMLSPTSTLADREDISGADVALGDVFAFGGGIGVQLPLGFGVEGQLLYAPGADLEPTGPQIASADDEVTIADAGFLAATGHLVYRFPLPLIQPFLGAGAGVRRVSLSEPNPLGTEGATDLTGSLVGGAYVDIVPGMTIRLEARDYLSGFDDPRFGDSEFQNDLAFLAGLAWRVP